MPLVFQVMLFKLHASSHLFDTDQVALTICKYNENVALYRWKISYYLNACSFIEEIDVFFVHVRILTLKITSEIKE